MAKIFFQSSMPRAGSTLLQNILGQNPDFYVTPTSGVLELFYAARVNYTQSPEFKAQDAELMRKGFMGFCKSGLEGFFNEVTDKPYVIDKSRGWGANYDFLNMFYPNPKVICMVRDPRSIISSMEKKFRNTQEFAQDVVNPVKMSGLNVQSRTMEWINNPPVGLALIRLQDIVARGIDKKILVVRFEDLTEKPQATMDRVYSYLEIDSYTHDFNNIEQITQEDDSIYGAYGDHKVRKEVKPLQKDYLDILGRVTSNFILKSVPWYIEKFDY